MTDDEIKQLVKGDLIYRVEPYEPLHGKSTWLVKEYVFLSKQVTQRQLQLGTISVQIARNRQKGKPAPPWSPSRMSFYALREYERSAEEAVAAHKRRMLCRIEQLEESFTRQKREIWAAHDWAIDWVDTKKREVH